MADAMGKVIGIDLGTTNSCVTVMEGGQPVVIARPIHHRRRGLTQRIPRDSEELGPPVAVMYRSHEDATFDPTDRKCVPDRGTLFGRGETTTVLGLSRP